MNERPPKPENRDPSPRFKQRGKTQQPKARADVDPNAIVDELKQQSDRGAAILAAAVLDQMLETVIEKRLLIFDSKQRKALLGRMAPLSTFSAKIEIGYAIGLFTSGAYAQLKMIQEVRNKFAHKLEPLRFDHADVAAIINDPKRTTIVRAKGPVTPRDEFLVTFSVIAVLLYMQQSEHDICLPTLMKTHPQISQNAAHATKIGVAKARQMQQPNQSPETAEPKK